MSAPVTIDELLRRHAELCRELADLVAAEPDPIRRAALAWWANRRLEG